MQNEIFLEVVKTHFAERLQDPAFYEMCGVRYPVRDEVQPIIERVKQHSSIGDVRIWTVVGKHRLKESNWMDLDFVDVTNNTVRRRERLESPLRSVLTKLYTGSTSSKTSRYPTNSQGQVVATPYAVSSSSGPPGPVPPPPPAFLHHQSSQASSHMSMQSSQTFRRTHDEMTAPDMVPAPAVVRNSAGMWQQLSAPAPAAAPMFTTPVMPETDRSWELKGELSGLILYEEAMMTDLCGELNKPGPYVSSLSSVVNEQLDDQANTCLAKKVAKQWLDERSSSRWVCWIDASDPLTLTTSYRQLIKRLQAQSNDFEQAAPKRGRLSASAAAAEFLSEFQQRFPLQCECLIVYVNVTHPEIFTEAFLPSVWLQDAHCQATIRGVLLSTPHPNYDGNMGAPYGNVVQHSIEWIPHWSESEKRYWWERLPQSNLPPLLDDVEEPQDIDRKLAMDGRALALVDLGYDHASLAGDVANQFARRWEMEEGTERFSVWLRAGSEASLRESYRLAIRRVTHSAPGNPLGNPVDLSVRVIGDELMSILMKVRELSPAKQWIMVFADAKEHQGPFYEQFFSGKSNWWNAKGRFVITSTTDNIEVEVMNEGMAYRKRVSAIICR